ncbi:MAG: alpha-ketoglutarate-dependent dioxygenase AlkB family protein [Prochlorococcaceae cyanobacterium]|jgi:alkylated DNA repair dioxygenase AlkB
MAHQLPLLSAPPQRLEAPGLRLRHWPAWLVHPHQWMALLQAEVPWKQERIRLFGREHPLPRLTCGMGDPGCHYRYSGVENPLEPWTPAVQQLRHRLERELGEPFNALLLNLYRHGEDHMGWHADDEPELDPGAPIASLSLGEARSFRLRPRPGGNTDAAPLSLELQSGDLLVMDPPTQRHWQHQLPPRRRRPGARINLTFRRVRR